MAQPPALSAAGHAGSIPQPDIRREVVRYAQTITKVLRPATVQMRTIVVADDHVRIDLALRTYTPVLIDAGYPELDLPIPWWGGRHLRFGFPPR
jgi:hypothetical protein